MESRLSRALDIAIYSINYIVISCALSGAAMLLLNETLRSESQRLAESSHTVDLSANPVFLELYTDNMFF